MPDSLEAKNPAIEPSELFISDMTLYHGSAEAGISRFIPSFDRVSVGTGVYFVDNVVQAIGYANRRTKDQKEGIATIYSAKILDLKLANLANQQKLDEIMLGFASQLSNKLKQVPPGTSWWEVHNIHATLEKINAGINVGEVADVTRTCSPLFSTYLLGIGYDGLKTPEGGEGKDVANHDTYLIFDSSNVEIINEEPIQKAMGFIALL